MWWASMTFGSVVCRSDSVSTYGSSSETKLAYRASGSGSTMSQIVWSRTPCQWTPPTVQPVTQWKSVVCRAGGQAHEVVPAQRERLSDVPGDLERVLAPDGTPARAG